MLRLHRDPTSIRASAEESSALLKKTLRKAFPAVKFSVRLSRGTAYGCCNVSYTDGPTPDRVNAILADFEGEGFDGMTDSATYKVAIMPDGRRSGLRLINAERTISADFARRIAAAVCAWWGGLPEPKIYESVSGSYKYWSIANVEQMTALDRTGRDWSQLIYQASNDRTIVLRELHD